MDFEKDNIQQGPQESLPSGPVPPVPVGTTVSKQPSKKRDGWKIFLGIALVLSFLANIFMFLMLIGLAVVFASGQGMVLTEEVIEKGPASKKIMVIQLEGIITGGKAQDIYQQLRAARKDERIKGLILRINSPGGTISGSDQIYHQISLYRQQTNKPVVAFMQGVAASGGYYASVSCDKIVAEPTAITGSIGVIMSHFVLQDLLENKLGIEPVVIKSGLKKDWPSYFQPLTEEQRQYLNEKLITPAYERFVDIVADGRSLLTTEDVKRLADGSIYGAQQALDEKMIDKVGYFEEAKKQVLSLAGISEARVVEYRKPLSLSSFLALKSKTGLKLDRAALHEMCMPQVLYLWDMAGGY